MRRLTREAAGSLPGWAPPASDRHLLLTTPLTSPGGESCVLLFPWLRQRDTGAGKNYPEFRRLPVPSNPWGHDSLSDSRACNTKEGDAEERGRGWQPLRVCHLKPLISDFLV